MMVPAGPPVMVPAGPPMIVQTGPPVLVPAGPPVVIQTGPPVMMPVGPPAMEAPPQPPPVIVQQDLGIPPDKKCHFDGCPHLAQYICSYPTCANCENKNLGCGKKMCDEHRSTKSYSKKKH